MKVKLTDEDVCSLSACCAMQFCGGSMPMYYGEYLRREKLRRRGLLRFFKRRSRNWRWNNYVPTERGQAAREAAA